MIRWHKAHEAYPNSEPYLSLGPLTVYFKNEWQQLFHVGNYNWYTLTVHKNEVEISHMTGSIDWEWYLFGFGVWVSWTYNSRSRAVQMAEDVFNELNREED